MPALSAGKAAPEFTLEKMDGGKFDLREVLSRGPVLAVFFKISCPVCQFTFPYLQRLAEKQTPISLKLVSGETLRGWIEYYDRNMLRLTRQGKPNLFIYKHQIAYLVEES